MNVFIARDGTVIGEYPRTELEAMARRGQLEIEDHYWQEGMEDWLPLPDLLGAQAWEPAPPPPAPLNPAVLWGGIAGALLCAALIVFWFIRPHRSGEGGQLETEFSLPQDSTTTRQIRDSAAADLRKKIERLPARATPPLNTFYYDVRVNMSKTLTTRMPWSASMRGFENVIDPKTEQTISRTEFALLADFQDGEWVYKSYRASTLKMADGSTTVVAEDQDSPTPPIMVGMMGLTNRGH